MLRRLLLLAMLGAGVAPALAQPPAAGPAPARPPAPWQVDWGQYYCSLIRQPGEGRPWSAAFLTLPGSRGSELMLVPEGSAPLPRRVTSVLLLPSGRSFAVTAGAGRQGARAVLTLDGLPYDFRTELEGATELQLLDGTEVRLRIPVERAGAAIAVHRRCTAEVSRGWQVDEARLLALREWPTSINQLGYRLENHPPAALRAGVQGKAILRITVTVEGHAADCAVVGSSGNAALDAASCRMVMARARFRPGRDADGRRVRIPAIFSIAWVNEGRPAAN